MSRHFNFGDWFKSLTLSENTYDDLQSALLDMTTNGEKFPNYSASFNTQRIFIKENLGFIEMDENGKYFLDIAVPRASDITTHFTVYPYDETINSSSDIKMEVLLGNLKAPIQYDTKLVNVFAIYTEIKLRITFDNEPFSIQIKYLNYLLQSDLRHELMKHEFTCSGIRYSEGIAMPV